MMEDMQSQREEPKGLIEKLKRKLSPIFLKDEKITNPPRAKIPGITQQKNTRQELFDPNDPERNKEITKLKEKIIKIINQIEETT